MNRFQQVRRSAASVVGGALIVGFLAIPPAWAEDQDSWRASSDKNGYLVEGGSRRASDTTDAIGAVDRAQEYRRAPAWLCGPPLVDMDDIEDPQPQPLNLELQPECVTGGINTVLDAASCEPGDLTVDPLFRRTEDSATPGGWTDWALVDDGCIAVADLSGAVANEFQRLPLEPPSLSVQPPSGWTLVNAETIAFADGSTRNLSTTVLGLNVTIRATPEAFTWDFGDGSAPLVTDDAGKAWPHHTVSHKYTREGTTSIALTTIWSATFQVAGTTDWQPVEGTATTTSTSPPLTIYEARARLVDASAD